MLISALGALVKVLKLKLFQGIYLDPIRKWSWVGENSVDGENPYRVLNRLLLNGNENFLIITW